MALSHFWFISHLQWEKCDLKFEDIIMLLLCLRSFQLFNVPSITSSYFCIYVIFHFTLWNSISLFLGVLRPDVVVKGVNSLHQQTILGHQKCVSKNSTWFCHYLLRDSIRFHRLRVQSYKITTSLHTHIHTLQTPVANPGCYSCFWPTN